MKIILKRPETIFKNGQFSECVCWSDRYLCKKPSDTTTDSKIRIFLREVRRRVRGFSENAFNFVKRYLTKSKTRGGHHRNYTSLADKRKVRRRFLCFSENACNFVKSGARSEIEEASFRNRRGVVQISKRRLSTRVKEQYHHLLLGNPYICRPSSFMARQT